MKKILILAISAILVTSVSAQEQRRECCKGKQFNTEERVEADLQRLKGELMLSDEQAEKFAATFREYRKELTKLFEKNEGKFRREPGKELTDKELDQIAKVHFEGLKEFANLQAKFYDKFRKDLTARQVEKVLRLNAPEGAGPCGGRPEGGPCGKHKGHQHGPRGHQCPHHGAHPGPAPAPESAPAPAPQAE